MRREYKIIKKSFDQPTLISKHYDSIIEEANFIVSENNFKDQVIHIIVNNIIIDGNKQIDVLSEDIKNDEVLHKELKKYSGEKIKLPKIKKFWPNIDFLQMHSNKFKK